MAPNVLLREDASFSISQGSVRLSLGDASVTVDADQLGELIRALEGIRFIVDGTTPGHTTGAGTTPPTPGTQAAAAQAGTRGAKPAAQAAPSRGAAPLTPLTSSASRPLVETATLVDAKLPPRKKRRSRKRVGDALEVWLGKNPGWHTEAELLQAVIDNQMTDADPKRALKIALGKQQNDRFVQDANGSWKLVSDDAPSPPPSKAGRKSGRASSTRKSTSSRNSAPKRLKTKLPKDTAAASAPKGEGDDEGDEARTVLVKSGQDRKSASLPPGELEARQAAADAVESRRPARWSKVKFNPTDLERARKNLFGLEGGGKGN